MNRVVLVVLAVVLSACHMDIFGLGTKTIAGPFKLNQWEDSKTYYLLGPEDTGWGTIDGTVAEIGWNEKYILVLQNDDGNGGGWRIIDTETEVISSVKSKVELQKNFEIEKIETYSAAVAWGLL